MLDLIVPQTLFAVPVTLFAVMAVCVMALVVLRKIRMERPPVGVFNGRDIAALYIFIIGLPLLYVVLPQWALTGFLIVTFAAALSIGYRAVLPRGLLWPAIGLLIGAEIWVAQNMLGTVEGWQLFMTMNSTLVLLTAVAVANLYVQGGMRLQHVAWFALTLGFYDMAFVSFTVRLADAFIGKPLNPSMGMRTGIFEANIGLGDLLVYALFTMAAFKAYGPRAARTAIGVIAVFGSIAPTMAPLIISEFTRGSTNIVTPAQIFFGPAAMVTYLLMKRRYGTERTFAGYRADPSGSVPPLRSAPAAARPVSPAPAQPSRALVDLGQSGSDSRP
jgi:hypothetical protein